MKVYKKGLDKWDLTPIIRQTDKVSLSVFPALNFILPYKRTCCVHRFSVGVVRPFLFGNPRDYRKGGVRSCAAIGLCMAVIKNR